MEEKIRRKTELQKKENRLPTKTEIVTYKHGNAVLKGYLAYDGTIQGERPDVLVFHCSRPRNKISI
jgi:hypothetical protein